MAERLIVVGVDGSDGGRRALDWALRHAASTGASVEVVTAFTWDAADWVYPGGKGDEHGWLENAQRTEVEDALATVEHAPSVSRVIVEGDATEVLTRAAEKADLLVLGSRGRGHLATALLGSVGAGCIRDGSTPVVVVPAHDHSPAHAAAAAVSRSAGDR